MPGVAATEEQFEQDRGWIELRRAPGTCCPEPSCDHGWHGKLQGRDPRELSLICEGCGMRCRECKIVPIART
jgi:hypothetical protein